MAKFALYVHLKTKQGKEAKLVAFLKQEAAVLQAEIGIVTRYGVQLCGLRPSTTSGQGAPMKEEICQGANGECRGAVLEYATDDPRDRYRRK